MAPTAYITPDDTPSGVIYIRVPVPDDVYMIAAFLAALSTLEECAHWQNIGGISAMESAEIWQEIMLDMIALPQC